MSDHGEEEIGMAEVENDEVGQRMFTELRGSTRGGGRVPSFGGDAGKQ